MQYNIKRIKRTQDKTMQCNTAQDNTKTISCNIDQYEKTHGMTRQEETRQHNKTIHGNTRHDKPRQDNLTQYETSHDNGRPYETRQYNTIQDNTRQYKAV